MPDCHIVIPARYGSSRLPGKPLLDIAGKPMIQRVYEQVIGLGHPFVIATDDARIEAAAKQFGADVMLTSANHASGTDRLQEVAEKLDLEADAILVNVQGDEPLIPAAVVTQVANNLVQHADAGISTLCEAITDVATVMNPNAVKVVRDAAGYALYFSRAPIPYARDGYAQQPPALPDMAVWRHIGIYGYRVGLLHDFVRWGTCPLEATEALEQLRAMWHGVRIHVDVACETPPAGVDTEVDLDRVRAIFR